MEWPRPALRARPCIVYARSNSNLVTAATAADSGIDHQAVAETLYRTVVVADEIDEIADLTGGRLDRLLQDVPLHAFGAMPESW